ncbi:MAG: RDD family protein [Pseudomarimonas sp.]
MSVPLPTSAGATLPAHLGWRLLAMLYDSLPLAALWIAVSALSLLLHAGVPIAPWSLLFWLQVLALWIVSGLYLVISWQRGGQTLGMRPWRLRLCSGDQQPLRLGRLWLRYVLATISLATGIGLLWSLFDRQRRCWHDIGSHTRIWRISR